MAIRLNKYLASCGLASRRKVEEFVLSGRVALNGRVVRDLSTTVEETDTVTLDGKEVSPESRVYIVMNKPQGVVCAVEDRFDMTVIDVLPPRLLKVSSFSGRAS
jgi:23S rRNA pseudouridine2605 synthase